MEKVHEWLREQNSSLAINSNIFQKEIEDEDLIRDTQQKIKIVGNTLAGRLSVSNKKNWAEASSFSFKPDLSKSTNSKSRYQPIKASHSTQPMSH